MHITLMPTFITQSSFIFHVESIPTHPSQSMNIEFHLIPIPCHFDTVPHLTELNQISKKYIKAAKYSAYAE